MEIKPVFKKVSKCKSHKHRLNITKIRYCESLVKIEKKLFGDLLLLKKQFTLFQDRNLIKYANILNPNYHTVRGPITHTHYIN